MKSFIYHNDTFYRDKGSKRNNFVNEEKPAEYNLQKFHKHRYYLFSKFDRGIKIDEESWYSITPENVAKHVASRVAEVYGEGNANAIDGFCGVGGNLIQLARKCGFCVGNGKVE
jgi:trimethylguanosine synthase